MMRITKMVLFALLLSPLVGARAQSTYNAASCNESAVATAISNENATPVDGDIIAIPACSSGVGWTSTLNSTFTNSVTIQGAGAESATSGGTSLTGTDQTVILDRDTVAGHALWSITTTAGKSFRFTGIAMEEDSSTTGVADPGLLVLLGSSTAVRVDHSHFQVLAGNKGIDVAGNAMTGVADFDYFDSSYACVVGGGCPSNPLTFYNGTNWNGISDASGSGGDSSWTVGDNFGTSQFFFVEDSQFNEGYTSDCSVGGRFVFRYNTMVNAVQGMASHGLTPGRGRGCRAAEVYKNTWIGVSGYVKNGTYFDNSGPVLEWGNSTTYYSAVALADVVRKDTSSGWTFAAPPNGWGYCGTAYGPSGWDENLDSTGRACMDQPGRGAGDMLSGTNFPTVCDQTQGCTTYNGQWPRQALDPMYVWDNTFDSNLTSIVSNSAPSVADNRDYFQQFGTGGESGTFNGTAGVGQGLYSAIPSTCSNANYPGSYPGPGYWATDQNTLYVCTGTNTWSAYYTPYTYPYPLTSGSTPAPPSGLTATVN